MDNLRFVWIAVFFTVISTSAFSFNSAWDTGHVDITSGNPRSGQIARNPCGRDGEGHAESTGAEQGSPVELTNGALVWHETDIVVAGRFPLTLSRTYSSLEVSVGMFGKGWVSNCERSLVKAQDYSSSLDEEDNFVYLLRLSNGKRFVFGDENSNTTSPPGLWAEIIERGDITELKWRNGRVDTYEGGLLIEERDGYGNSIDYRYTDSRLTEVSTNDGRWIRFTYDSENWVVLSARDNTGRSWYYQYNEYMELTSVRSPEGTRYYTYYGEDDLPAVGGFADAYSFLSTVTDETGVQELSVDYVFDNFENLGRVSSYTEGLIRYSYQYTWGTFGTFAARVVSVNKSGNGINTTYTLNEDGQISGESGVHGSVTYDRNDDYQSEVTRVPTGYVINTEYDDRGRPISVSNGRGTTVYTYSGEYPTPTRIALPDDLGSYNYVLNAQGDVISAQDPAGNTYDISRNNLGDITQITLPGGTRYWRFGYNDHGLLQSVQNPMGQNVQYIRDDRGNILRYVAADQREWLFTYDALGRKLSETSPEGARTTYSYDAAGRKNEVVLDSGESFRFYYDEFGRLVRENNFWGEDTVLTYVPNTYRLATVTDPNGNVTTYDYNSKNELISKRTSDQTINYVYDDNGRLLSVSNDNQAVAYQYNAYSEITRRTTDNIQFSFSYDTLGRLDGFTTPAGGFSYSYNALGLQSRVSSPAGDFNYQYDDYGRLTRLSRPNGVSTDYNYDEADRVLSIVHGSIGGFNYEYDLGNRITRKSGFGNSVNYGYDNDERLTGAAYTIPLADGTSNETFSYDSLGNRTDNSAVYSSGNRLASDSDFTYEYDSNGNRTKRVNRVTGAYELYTYSNWNQLIRYQRYAGPDEVLPESDVTYSYGPEGQRISKSVDGVLKRFLWNGTDLVGEVSDSVTRYYFSGLVVDGTEYLFPLKDHLSVVTSISDQSGDIVWSGTYKAFGQMQISNDSIEWNKRYPGQYYDDESGLHYNYFRDYDPGLGRYVQSDPIGLDGGLNTYAYANQNPLRYIDPTGETAATVPIIIGGGGILLGCYLTGTCQKIADACGDLFDAYGGWGSLAKPPSDAHDPDGAKAPGKPGADEGFEDPKGGEDWVKNPNGRGNGWLDSSGNVWIPTGQGGGAHGGSHWDVQTPGGGHVNVYPGGHRR